MKVIADTGTGFELMPQPHRKRCKIFLNVRSYKEIAMRFLISCLILSTDKDTSTGTGINPNGYARERIAVLTNVGTVITNNGHGQ